VISVSMCYSKHLYPEYKKARRSYASLTSPTLEAAALTVAPSSVLIPKF
jgi:hypothetical protein